MFSAHKHGPSTWPQSASWCRAFPVPYKRALPIIIYQLRLYFGSIIDSGAIFESINGLKVMFGTVGLCGAVSFLVVPVVSRDIFKRCTLFTSSVLVVSWPDEWRPISYYCGVVYTQIIFRELLSLLNASTTCRQPLLTLDSFQLVFRTQNTPTADSAW